MWADEIKPDSDGSSKSFLSFESTEKDAAAELLEGRLDLVAGRYLRFEVTGNSTHAIRQVKFSPQLF